jgi:hypothetical protein
MWAFDRRFVMGAKAMLHPPLLIAAIAYSSTVVSQALQDRLRIHGIVGGDKVVVMMDARRSPGATGCAQDRVLRSTGITTLGNLLSSGGCNSEIAIFSANNAMLLETPVGTWTDSPGDIHTATLQPIIEVPVSVWIAHPAAAKKAKRDIARANVLYKRNKVGVRFVPTFTPVTGAALATINDSVGLSPDGTDIECKNIPGVQGSSFYTAKRLNVYYVTLAITGRNCAILQTPTSCPGTGSPRGDGNITYIGTAANRASLAHEFGHAFGLRPGPCGGHTNTVSGFGSKNIMWGGGDANRDRFTLGQVFRMNTHRDEWGGTMLIENGLLPGPGRQCPPSAASATCPVLKTDWVRP